MRLDLLVTEWQTYHEKMRDLRPSTRKAYAYHLKRFIEDFEGETIADLTAKACRLYIADKANHSLHMAHAGLASLRSLVEYAMDEGYLRGDPTKSIKHIKPPDGQRKPAKEAEIRRLMAACEQRIPSQRAKARAILSLCVYAGLRAEEISLFAFRDLDIESGQLTVPNGKGGKERKLALCKEGIQGVLAYFAGKEPSSTIGLKTNAIRASLAVTCKIAGVQRLTPHNFRHSCATRLLINGANIKKVQVWLGHTNLATTSLYVHTDDDEMIEIAELASLNAVPKTETPKPKPAAPQGKVRSVRREMRRG